MLPSFSTWSLNFFLFVNFDFSYFFVFFENKQYQRRLKCGKSMILKMTREKSNAFENILTIEILFLDDVENAKRTKIY